MLHTKAEVFSVHIVNATSGSGFSRSFDTDPGHFHSDLPLCIDL